VLQNVKLTEISESGKVKSEFQQCISLFLIIKLPFNWFVLLINLLFILILHKHSPFFGVLFTNCLKIAPFLFFNKKIP